MEIRFGIQPNCSEWNEEVGPSYRDNAVELSPADEEYFSAIERTLLENVKDKEWD